MKAAKQEGNKRSGRERGRRVIIYVVKGHIPI
jgi:hypothetical protein